MGLPRVLAWWITKCGNSGLQSVLGVGLEIVATVNYSALGIPKCGGITKWISTCFG